MKKYITPSVPFIQRILPVLALCSVAFHPVSGQEMSAEQERVLTEQVAKAAAEAITAGTEKLLKQRIMGEPSILKIDSKAQTVTVEFFNPSTDTLEAEILVSNVHPGLIMVSKSASTASTPKTALLDDPETPGKEPTITEQWSMVSWLKNLPPKIRLAPGEKKKVTLTLQKPTDLAAGNYSAWIIAVTAPGKQCGRAEGSSSDATVGTATVSACVSSALVDANGNTGRLTSVVKAMYTVTAP